MELMSVLALIVIITIIVKVVKNSQLTIEQLYYKLEHMTDNEIKESLKNSNIVYEYSVLIEKCIDEGVYESCINEQFETVLSKILNNCDNETLTDIVSTIYEKDENQLVFWCLREECFKKNVIKRINNIYKEEVIFRDTYDNKQRKIKNEYLKKGIKEENIVISNYDNIAIDYNKNKVYVKNTYEDISKEKVINFNELLSCEKSKTNSFESKSNTNAKNGINRAIAGGILFGGAGAIVGANTAERVTQTTMKEKTEKLVLNIITSNIEIPIIKIVYDDDIYQSKIDRIYAKIIGIISICKNELQKQ